MDETKKDTTLIGRFNSWWSHPFQSGGTAFSWVMFVGLVIIATFLWQLVLLEITKEV